MRMTVLMTMIVEGVRKCLTLTSLLSLKKVTEKSPIFFFCIGWISVIRYCKLETPFGYPVVPCDFLLVCFVDNRR